MINRVAALPFIVCQAIREVGEPLLEVADVDPRQVVVKITEVGVLPVENHSNVIVSVHEVARTRITLDEDDGGPRVVRHMAAQPGRRHQNERFPIGGAVEVYPLPDVDLILDVSGNGFAWVEFRKMERARIDLVYPRNLRHEVRGDGDGACWVLDLGEPVPALDPAHQERLLRRVHGDQGGDAHG